MDYQIVHAIEGRVRIRMPQLAEESFGQQLRSQVEQLKAVKSVRINPQAVSMVIIYRDRLITSAAIQEELHQIIEQLILPEPSDISQAEPVTASDEPATAPNAPTASVPSAVNLNEDVWADPAETVVPDPQSETKLHPDLAPEILKTETANETLHPLPEPAGCTTCSTALLAKRLGVSIQAINLRRSKPEFAEWSQTKDPDGIAWRYQEAAKIFVPVPTVL